MVFTSKLFALAVVGVAAEKAATKQPKQPEAAKETCIAAADLASVEKKLKNVTDELSACQKENKAIQQQLKDALEQNEILKANVEEAISEVASGHLTWAVATDWLHNTLSIQRSVVGTLYSKVVKPQHEDMIAAHYENAKNVAYDALGKAQTQAKELYDKHLSKHYEKHAAAHVNKVTDVVGDHVENVGNLYKLHLEEHVNKAKVQAIGHGSQIWDKTMMFVNNIPNKVHDAVAPKIDMVVSHFPEHAHNIPETLHDRLLLFTLVLGLSVMYVLIGAKVARVGVCLSTCVLKKAFSIVWFFVTLPFAILTCKFCRKRAGAAKTAKTGAKGKQTFSKPPAANATKPTVAGKSKKR